jgi:hypothetical protein
MPSRQQAKNNSARFSSTAREHKGKKQDKAGTGYSAFPSTVASSFKPSSMSRRLTTSTAECT